MDGRCRWGHNGWSDGGGVELQRYAETICEMKDLGMSLIALAVISAGSYGIMLLSQGDSV